ncbi:hypothetical protein BH11PSE3_BH11PSE3_48260 [soil metagenome]
MLHGDHEVVQPHRFARAQDKQQGDRHDDGRRRQVGDRRDGRSIGQHHRLSRAGDEFRRQAEPCGDQEAVEVPRPATGHGGDADGVLQDQVPADHPGYQLAQRGVGVGIGRALHRQEGGQLGIAEPDQGARHGSQDERQGDGRAGIERGRRAGQHEYAGADDRADAHGDDADGAQDLGDRFASAFRRDNVRHQLARKKSPGWHHSPVATFAAWRGKSRAYEATVRTCARPTMRRSCQGCVEALQALPD